MILNVVLAMGFVQAGLPAARVESFEGRVVLSAPDGGKGRVLAGKERPWILHGGRIAVRSGWVSFRQMDDSVVVLRPKDGLKTIYRRWTPEESRLLEEFNRFAGKAVRSRGGDRLRFPSVGRVPASLLAIQMKEGERVGALQLRGPSGPPVDVVLSSGRSASASLSVSVAAWQREEAPVAVDVYIDPKADLPAASFFLMGRREEAQLLKELADAAKLSKPVLKSLARAAAFHRHGLYEYALYEFGSARREGPPYPFARASEAELRELGYRSVPPKSP